MGKLDKLTINNQIEHMKVNGITFGKINSETSEENAKNILSEKNYYFRLKSYARNFSKINGSKKQYADLDFEHLHKFANLDFHFRNLILKMVYSIEHFMKVRLL